jgi:CxxC motif-containing protein
VDDVPAPDEIICIGCPLGCRVTVRIDKRGKIAQMKGAECKQGEKYVQKEFTSPVRTLTATVRTGSERFPLLPVRTSRPVPRDTLRDMMLETAKIKVKPPVEVGEVIARNVLDTGSDLIATSEWHGQSGS